MQKHSNWARTRDKQNECRSRFLESFGGRMWRLTRVPVHDLWHDPSVDDARETSDYERRIRAGEMPPAVVIVWSRRYPGRLVVIDGNHRVAATKRAGLADVKAFLEEPRLPNPVRPRGDPLFDVREALSIPRRRRREDDEDEDQDEDEPPKILQPEHGYRLYAGEHVAWIGEPGRNLKLGWDRVKPVQGNIFDPEKVAHFYERIRAANASRRKMRFPAPPAWLFTVDRDYVAQSQHDAKFRPGDLEYERQTRPYTTGDDELDAYLAEPEQYVEENASASLDYDQHEAEAAAFRADLEHRLRIATRKKQGDLGQIVAQLRDGNHRAFAAQLAGEPALWVHVVRGEEGDLDPAKLK